MSSVPFPPRLAFLTIDVEPDLRCLERRTRLFEEEPRFSWFCDMLAAEGVPVTAFVQMAEAHRYREPLAALAERIPVELAVHSFSHDQTRPATQDEIERSWNRFGEIWNHAPRGYRAPNCLMNADGLRNLMRRGFLYDSSITPSVRYDAYGYNNLHLPRSPFLFRDNVGHLVEFPVATLSGLRLPLVMSFIKLFGWSTYRALLLAFPLPSVVTFYLHPYDLYADAIAGNMPGWKRHAHLRNATAAPAILVGLIRWLKRRGYQFSLMAERAKQLEITTLAAYDVEIAGSISEKRI